MRVQFTGDDTVFQAGASKMLEMVQMATAQHLAAGTYKPSDNYIKTLVNPVIKHLQRIIEGRVPYARAGYMGREERNARERCMRDRFLDFHEFLAKHNDVAYVEFSDKFSPGKRLRDSSWNDGELWWAQEALGTAMLFTMREQNFGDAQYYDMS